MDATKCEACGADATVHVTDVGSQRSLCAQCAVTAGLLNDNQINQDFTGFVEQLRSLAGFIRSNNRMPSPAELSKLGMIGELTTQPGTAAFDEQLRYLERFAHFIEQHQRPPTEDELPDPF